MGTSVTYGWIRTVLALLHARIRETRSAAERGTAMFITCAGMTVIIGMAAMGIDTAQWYQSRHQTQVAADAAALAAADCLANAGSGQTCTSPTDTTAASQVATTIANDNHVPISSVSYSANQVTVTTAETAPETFAGAFMSAPRVSQSASASFAPSTCNESAQVVGDCWAIFGMSEVCGVDTGSTTGDVGVSIPANGISIKGAINANGSLFGGSGNTFGPGWIGNQCGLSPLFDYASSGSDLFAGATQPVGQPAVPSWPVDYSKDFPSCGGSGPVCSPSGTPSFCSASAASFSFTAADPPEAGYIYCAYGSGTESDPSTWNGSITVSGGGGTSADPTAVTFVGGSVSIGSGAGDFESCGYSTAGYTAAGCQGASGQTMPAPPLCSQSGAPSPCNYPFIYAADNLLSAPTCDTRVSTSVCILGGTTSFQGDIFAAAGNTLPPSGTGTVLIDAASGSTTMVEAYNVLWLNGNAIGDGPNSTSSTTQQAQLTQ